MLIMIRISLDREENLIIKEAVQITKIVLVVNKGGHINNAFGMSKVKNVTNKKKPILVLNPSLIGLMLLKSAKITNNIVK